MPQDLPAIASSNWEHTAWHDGVFTTVPAGGTVYGVGLCICWQHGPVENGIPNGCFVETVIAAAIARMTYFQSGRFACPENAVALEHLHRALGALESRTARREAAGVANTIRTHHGVEQAEKTA